MLAKAGLLLLKLIVYAGDFLFAPGTALTLGFV
jgi:hypothetical protein